jgi:hypothetical protein
VPLLETLEPRRLCAGTLVITQGGTYRGSWESNDPKVPAVEIRTAQPVIIENSTVKSRGDLILATVRHTDVTIRNTLGTALNPNVLGRSPGRFFKAEAINNVLIENNQLEGTRGIHILEYAGNFSTAQTIRIFDNYAHNIDGRLSDGKGGWLDYNVRTNKTTKVVENGFAPAQFVQLDKVIKVPGIEIAGNEIINDPGNSRVEDTISIYKSSGLVTSPISIHHNFIQGGYSIKPWQGNTSDATYDYSWTYTGGGILLGDGAGKITIGNTSFAKAWQNVVLDTTNYGVAVAGGHDMLIESNRILSAGVLSDGRPIASQNTGMYIWDTSAFGVTYFYNNTAKNNVVGWVNPLEADGRNDWWLPNATNPSGDMHWASKITRSQYAVERNNWEAAHLPGLRGSIAGTLFADPNADGVRAASDPAAVGFSVYLDQNNDGVFQTGEPTAKSSSTGRYKFNDLKPGAYVVRLMTKTGLRPSKGAAAVLKVNAGEMVTRYFGFTQMPLVTGMAYLDKDQDGGRDPGEGGLSGWTAYADLNHNGELDDGEYTTTTNKLGRYALSLPSPGNYQVRVVQKPGYKITAPASAYRAVAAGVGQIVEGRNFGQTRV